MTNKVLILVGTKKGAFVLESDAARKSWELRGPYCETWPMNHVIADPETGTIYGAGGNEWFGPAVWKSTDLGRNWTHSSDGLAYQEGDEPVKTVWSLSASNGALYAGVQPAGLFRSDDHGQSWRHVEGLQEHPSRPQWNPGGAGLILHSLLVHPRDEKQIWVGISAAGVFHTADGGKTWEPRNRGTRADYNPEDQRYPEFGQCVHCVVLAPGGGERLYQQNHCGMYRSDDGGDHWREVSGNLPTDFGFAIGIHPGNPDCAWIVPLEADVFRCTPEGKLRVYRTRDAGASWQPMTKGLPQEDAYETVLRDALSVDPHAGVYFGTRSGKVFASIDEGESWTSLADGLPPVVAVKTAVVS